MLQQQLVLSLVCALFGSAGDRSTSVTITPDTTPQSTAPREFPNADLKLQEESIVPTQRLRHDEVVRKLGRSSSVRRAQKLMDEKNYKSAIDCLESVLDEADANPAILDLLEAAYRQRLSQLVVSGNNTEASQVAERLRALTSSVVPVTTEKATAAKTRKAFRDDSAVEAAPVSSERIETIAKTAIAKETKAAGGIGSILSKASNLFKDTPVANHKEPVKFATADRVPSREADADAAPYSIPGKPDRAAQEERIIPVAHRKVESNPADRFIREGNSLYRSQQFAKALSQYQRAYEEDPMRVNEICRIEWGYSLLFVTIEKYNELIRPENPSNPDQWDHLESDAKLAGRLLSSKPDLTQKVNEILSVIPSQRRWSNPDQLASNSSVQERGTSRESAYRRAANPDAQRPAGNYRHYSSGQWLVIESENFQLLHRDRVLAEEVIALAEQYRTAAYRKWFPSERVSNWSPKCVFTLYMTAQEYGQATQVGIQSPGHSKIANDNGRVTRRELYLRADDPNMKNAILPHEVAHVVFAGMFGVHSLPRWADEGMAVLTEPVDKQDLHLVNLGNLRRGGSVLPAAQLMSFREYPPGGQMRDFYAQSVGLCRLLVEKGGEKSLVSFLRMSLNSNDFDGSLRQTYGMSLAQLEREYAAYGNNLAQSASNSGMMR